jgi:hypothetical protein
VDARGKKRTIFSFILVDHDFGIKVVSYSPKYFDILEKNKVIIIETYK